MVGTRDALSSPPESVAGLLYFRLGRSKIM
nr:MAG TPA: hypothetical protein [Bacteriophage sp.]